MLTSYTLSFGQSFEGWITYKTVALNPNSEIIPDSVWQKIVKEQFGEQGFISFKNITIKRTNISLR